MLHLVTTTLQLCILYKDLEENVFQNFHELCSLMCEQSISAEKLKLQKTTEQKENNKVTGDSEKIVEKHVKKSWLKISHIIITLRHVTGKQFITKEKEKNVKSGQIKKYIQRRTK